MKLIAEYSDYAIQSIEYFATAIETAINSRDLAGLSNNTIEIISVTKEHPLVTMMAASLNPNIRLDDIRAGLIPAISVTPGNMGEEAVTHGLSPETYVVNDDWITEFKRIYNLDLKDIHKELLITKDQIDYIISEYRKNNGIMRCQKNGWGWNEEINISCWSNTPDIDVLVGTLVDSVLAKIRVGTLGDNSPVKNMKYRPTKGLTNFNFGRPLFGTEYNLTFFNTYHNYTIYTEEHVTGHDLNGTFKVPGSDETWQMPTE